MIPYAYVFTLSTVVNAAVALPIILLHGFALLDSLGITAVIGITGAAPAIRACRWSDASPADKRRLATKFTLFCPVFILLIHALLWSVARYSDTKQLLPDSALHWMNWLFAVVAFIAWIAFYYNPRRNSPEPNKAPEPTP